jgi:hypothetical protein
VGSRKLFRGLALFGALAFTLYQGAAAKREYQEWKGLMRIGDLSAADLYRLNLEIDCVEMFAAWSFTAGLIYLLRPKSPPQP